jgi:hypothetical protein
MARHGAQLAGLWALAVAQPFFDVTDSGELYLRSGWRGGDIVAFAFALAFLPPLLMVLVEAVAARVRPRAGQVAHLVFVGAVAAVFAAHVVKQETTWTTEPSLVIMLAAGSAFALLFARFEPVRMFVLVLAPASLLFVGLFLLNSPVRSLVFPADGADLSGPRPASPVVMIVFDEFPTLSLLDGRGELDRRAYPAFARLAREGTWFRNATTDADSTAPGTAAILTGRRQKGKPPTHSAQPDNLLALLGARGPVDVQESPDTRLCPAKVCPVNAPRGLPERITDARETFSELSLGTWLPDGIFRHLLDARRRFAPGHVERGFQRLDASFARAGALHYLHPFMPHQPWYGLPSGRHYVTRGQLPKEFIPGRPDVPRATFPRERWTEDRGLVTHLLQRHLAQVRYTDRLLGRTLDRLRATGVYDRATIVVTADHGIAFEPGEDSRKLTRRNAPGIAFVPLFVLTPGQRRGSTSDRFAQTVDIAPTVADALGIELPWRVDGRSLLDAGAPDRAEVSSFVGLTHERLEFPAAKFAQGLRAEARDQAALFHGAGPERVFRAGANGDLVGSRVDALAAGPPSALRHVPDVPDIRLHPRTGIVPALIGGRIRGPRAEGRELVLALDGVIAASTRTHAAAGGTRFDALVAERLLQPGRNRLTVYEVGPGRRPSLLADTPP